MDCIRCNGLGILSVRGDESVDCPACGGSGESIDGLRELLAALNKVAYSRMVCEDKLVEKYTNRYTVIYFRLRPWRLSLVNEAHNQHMLDCEQALLEWRAS